MKHENETGKCSKCRQIIEKYPGFYAPLSGWFYLIQEQYHDCHVSEAGRGRIMQDVYFQRGASRAKYGQSSHNWNIGLDLFRLVDDKAVYEVKWFNKVVGANLTPNIIWYGRKGAAFFELGHTEWKSWHGLADLGELKLVE